MVGDGFRVDPRAEILAFKILPAAGREQDAAVVVAAPANVFPGRLGRQQCHVSQEVSLFSIQHNLQETRTNLSRPVRTWHMFTSFPAGMYDVAVYRAPSLSYEV